MSVGRFWEIRSELRRNTHCKQEMEKILSTYRNEDREEVKECQHSCLLMIPMFNMIFKAMDLGKQKSRECHSEVRFVFKLGSLMIKLYSSCSSQFQNSSEEVVAYTGEWESWKKGSIYVLVLGKEVSIHKTSVQ